MEKTPRLFYWEEGVDAWCPIDDNLDIASIIGIGNFTDNGEVIAIKFKRIDMTDDDFNNLPEE